MLHALRRNRGPALLASAAVGLLVWLAPSPPAHASTSDPRPTGDAVVRSSAPARLAQAGLAAASTEPVGTYNLRPIHYTVVRLEFPDAHAGGDLATDAQVTAAVAGAQAYWARQPGMPHPTFDVIHAVISVEGPALVDIDQEMKIAVENVTGRQIDGLIGYYRTGWPWPHYTCHADMPGDMVACFGAFPTDVSPANWQPLAHEIGHNFGLCGQNVNGYLAVHDRQNPSRWTPESFTQVTSYGNPYSIMGGGAYAPSVPCQAAAGVLTTEHLYLGRWTSIFNLQESHSHRGFTYEVDGHRFAFEYRPQLDQLDHRGVALYRDGRIVETASCNYTLPLKKWYAISATRKIYVSALWKWRGHLVATVLLARR